MIDEKNHLLSCSMTITDVDVTLSKNIRENYVEIVLSNITLQFLFLSRNNDDDDDDDHHHVSWTNIFTAVMLINIADNHREFYSIDRDWCIARHITTSERMSWFVQVFWLEHEEKTTKKTWQIVNERCLVDRRCAVRSLTVLCKYWWWTEYAFLCWTLVHSEHRKILRYFNGYKERRLI